MGYFSNGTEGEIFREQWCYRCVHWKDEDDGRGPGCPVMDAHFLYAYKECNSQSNAEAILHLLMPTTVLNGVPTNECMMFAEST